MLCCHDNQLRYKVQSPKQIHNRQIEQNESLCIMYPPPCTSFTILVVYKNEESTPLIRPKRVYAPKAVLKFCSKKKEGTYYGNKYPPYLPTYLFNQFNFRSIFLISVKLYFL